MLKTQNADLLATLLYSSLRDDYRYWVYQDHTPSDIDGLEKAGLLRPTTPAGYYTCTCEHGGGEVFWSHALGQEYAHVRCGCGTYRIAPQEIQRWELIHSVFIQRIGKAMGFSAPYQEVCPSIVWKFGRSKRREFYYLRRADFNLRRTLRELFVPHPKAVLILPSPECMEFLDALPNPMFAVESIGELDEKFNLTIDMTAIEAELEPAEQEQKRPRVKRGNRAANIEKLIAELKEHCRASKDHYYAIGGELLPKPTQAELAKRAGISQSDVSRCLTDPDATLLQILWREIDNPQYVLNR